MPGVRPVSHPRRLVAAVLLLAQSACLSSPRPVESPGPYLRSETPKRIWVSLATGEQMVIDGPQLFGDTLLGYRQKGEEREEVWLPLTQLREVRTRHVSGLRTALLGGAVAAGVALLILSIPTAGGELIRPCMNEGVPCESA